MITNLLPIKGASKLLIIRDNADKTQATPGMSKLNMKDRNDTNVRNAPR